VKDEAMPKADDCQERAEKCRALAASALSAEDRMRWLAMANFWTKQSQAGAKPNAAPEPKVSDLVAQLCSHLASKS
jgi:hypothetical protein